MNAGFYKKDGDGLLYGPNGIYTPTFSLLEEQKDNYTYPVDGWYWFDDDESAYSFFNLVKPQIEENNKVENSFKLNYIGYVDKITIT